MRLIAESGSTKAEWCLLEGSHVLEHAFTEGINPYFQTRREISRCIRLQLPEKFFTRKLDEIIFYGAGCTSEEKKNIVKASLTSQFRVPTNVYSDLLAAARSLFGKEEGIACILGTGSNTGLYDGSEIIQNVKSLGYVLGDEGSSSVIGKMFLSDCLKNLAPADLTQKFYDIYHLTADDALDLIYNKPFPNRTLSKFSYFLLDFVDDEYVNDLISKNFRRFFRRNILQYDYQKYPVGFIGTVAYSYQDILHSVAKEFDIKIASITESPMKGLVDYYYPKLL
jgi:N-acetylglucosamine kinase-like BadF-type ATPase